MVDLTEFNGEDALRASLMKKREKVQEKLDAVIAKAQEKITPLQAQIEKFDALLAVLSDPHMLVKPPTPEQAWNDETVAPITKEACDRLLARGSNIIPSVTVVHPPFTPALDDPDRPAFLRK